jgi:hypothetical protein
MIRSIACFVVEGVTTDAETGQASVFRLIENIRTLTFPVTLPRISLFCRLAREAGDPAACDVELSLALNGRDLHRQAIGINFAESLHARSTVIIDGISLAEPGDLVFRLTSAGQDIADWVIAAGRDSPPSMAGNVTVGLALAPPIARNCGTCTACCSGLFTATIRGHEMKAGVPCHFRGAVGCTIHPERPDFCRNFYCAWRREDQFFPEEFRPDRLGVLIASNQWRNRPAYELIAAGRDPDAALLAWMEAFSIATGAPFIYRVGGEQWASGSDEFKQEMANRAARGEPLL